MSNDLRMVAQCAAIALASIISAGCAHQAVVDNSAVVAELSASAGQIEQAWSDLAAVEKSRNPTYQRHTDEMQQMVGGEPSELTREIDVQWSGEIGQFILEMASAANYRVVVEGRIPPVPVLVFVRGRYRIGDALKEAGVQAGDRAGVILRPQFRKVVLTYVDGAPKP